MRTDGKRDFFVREDYVTDRTGDYDAQGEIVAKWEYVKKRLSPSNGNVQSQCYWDREKDRMVFFGYNTYSKKHDSMGDEKFNERYIRGYNLISSPLLLYRLICLFLKAPICHNGYKSIWGYTLKHKETEREIMFSEWKGSSGFWLNASEYRELDKSFLRDLKELYSFILSDKIAHPYDNTVAGSCA